MQANITKLNPVPVLLSIALLFGFANFASGQIDLNNLENYANQPVPNYIAKDNTPLNNPISDSGATLGRILFYDKLLSTNNTISCASCHQQQHAFSDLEARSVGVNGALTPRHSMRLVNARFSEDEKFRWDKEAPNLEAQMTNPIRNADEMGYSGQNGNPSFADLIQEMAATSYYPPLFNSVFGDEAITEERMQLAMAQFVRSIQSFDTKYDIGRAQVSSDSEDFPNFTAEENTGKQLFLDDFQWVEDEITVPPVGGQPGGTFPAARRVSGGLNCATCHRPPEFDIDPDSLNNGFVRPSPPGPGNPLDVVVFRSPTLRDMVKADGTTLNGGMFHSGAANGINQMFAHYDFRRIEPDNPFLDERMTKDGLPQWLDATVQERQSLFAFLRTLTGNDFYTNVKWSDPFNANGSLDLTFHLGDVNRDGLVNLADVGPFIEALNSGTYQFEADTNQDGQIDLLDVSPFVAQLTGT